MCKLIRPNFVLSRAGVTWYSFTPWRRFWRRRYDRHINLQKCWFFWHLPYPKNTPKASPALKKQKKTTFFSTFFFQLFFPTFAFYFLIFSFLFFSFILFYYNLFYFILFYFIFFYLLSSSTTMPPRLSNRSHTAT